MVINMDMYVVVTICPTGIGRVPTRPVTPVPRRSPTNPSRSPKPIVNNRSIDIYWFDNVVGTIYILVTYHLYRYFLVSLVLHINRCHILENIFSQYGLYQYQMVIAIFGFYDTKIIHRTISVQVQVAQVSLFGVQFFLKLFQVFYFAEQVSHGF